MYKRAIWMQNGSGSDAAIQRGLMAAGCEVTGTHSIIETLNHIKTAAQFTSESKLQMTSPQLVLVADVQAGAIPLLMLLREHGIAMPPTLVFDRDGSDIRPAITALRLGAREYLLASDTEVNRELSACVLAERYVKPLVQSANAVTTGTRKSHVTAQDEFHWDGAGQAIRIGSQQIGLSPIEARVFGLLYERRGLVVSMQDFVTGALRKPQLDVLSAARQLRPHVMRLRRKLNQYSQTANRLVNTRGAGYMLV